MMNNERTECGESVDGTALQQLAIAGPDIDAHKICGRGSELVKRQLLVVANHAVMLPLQKSGTRIGQWHTINFLFDNSFHRLFCFFLFLLTCCSGKSYRSVIATSYPAIDCDGTCLNRAEDEKQ